MNSVPPIIIIGMHRSGTTLVSSLLESAGLFLGYNKEINNEAVQFIQFNNWILRQYGATWDNTAPAKEIITDGILKDYIVRYFREITAKSLFMCSYLGFKKLVKYRGLNRLDIPWGWKDPRNTFTFPIWQEVYNECKVIHVLRNGIDVALSLHRRTQKAFENNTKNYFSKPIGTFSKPLKNEYFIDSSRFLTLEGAFSLWYEYVTQAKKHTEILGDRSFTIKYEDLLQNPLSKTRELIEFCGIRNNEEEIINNIRKIKPANSPAKRLNTDAIELSRIEKDKLLEFGYQCL